MRHSHKKIQEIINLRKKGYTISELVKTLSVPKTTIWHHIQKVKVLPKYEKIWKAKQGGSINRFKAEIEKAQKHAKSLIKSVGKLEKILIAASLYWGEGAKGDFSLSNTDPKLIKVFISCLKEFGVTRDNLSINVRIYEDLDPEKVCRFWAKVAGVPLKEIKYVNVLYGKKNGKLPYGMCRIRVKKPGYLLKLFNAIREIIIGFANQNMPP